MTDEQKQAYEWALNQQYQSVAAKYARTLAEYIRQDRIARQNPQPLTTEGLRGMDKDSVYLATSTGIYACIVQVRRHRDDCGDITLVHDTHFTFTPDDGLAYRTKPEMPERAEK